MVGKTDYSCYVAIWPIQITHNTGSNRVCGYCKHDGNGRRRRLRSKCCWRSASANDYTDAPVDKISCQSWQAVVVVICPAIFDGEILTLDKASFPRRSRNICRRSAKPSAVVLLNHPINGIGDCCACAVFICATAAPPITAMNSRRFIRSPRRRAAASDWICLIPAP